MIESAFLRRGRRQFPVLDTRRALFDNSPRLSVCGSLYVHHRFFIEYADAVTVVAAAPCVDE